MHENIQMHVHINSNIHNKEFCSVVADMTLQSQNHIKLTCFTMCSI